jgi:hypothetical protein
VKVLIWINPKAKDAGTLSDWRDVSERREPTCRPGASGSPLILVPTAATQALLGWRVSTSAACRYTVSGYHPKRAGRGLSDGRTAARQASPSRSAG